jgi:Bacterial TSP3 repeat
MGAQGGVVGGDTPQTGMRLNYFPSDHSGTTGYLLGYRPIGCLLPGVKFVADQGPSAIDIGNPTTHTFTLTGLTIGQRYEFGLIPYDAMRDIGPGVVVSATFVDPTDVAPADGIPDQWEALYGVTNPNADPDHDGLTNAQEYAYGTDPNNAYTAGGKYADGELYAAGLSACSPLDPGAHRRPKLTLVGDGRLRFKTPVNASGPPPSQTITIINLGAGLLDWTATASDPWITLDKTAGGQTDGPVKIGVNPTGLPPGHYAGMVTFNNTYVVPGVTQAATAGNAPSVIPGDIVTETAQVDVVLDMLPMKEFLLYMPMLSR